MAKKSYGNKKLSDTTNYTNYGDVIRNGFSRWKILRFVLVLTCIAVVLWAGRRVAQAVLPAFNFVAEKTTETITQQIGTKPILDDFGAINVLLMGYGGAEHHGGFLTDSILVAHFQPDTGNVSMVSIPRDLWVETDTYEGKINSFFAHAMALTPYTEGDMPLEEALNQSAGYSIEVVEDITGLEIPYYALVSFADFETFVDTMGGITVDVPERLVDYEFPDVNLKGYDPLIVESGTQLMDGELALKYARSRKSTSDFSRSYRQQQIIQSIINGIRGNVSLTNLGKIESLYKQYQRMVHTNLDVTNILYLSQYQDQIDSFSSHVLTYECLEYYTQMTPGCFLTTPPRSRFQGAAVLAPQATTANNLTNYDDIHDFVYLVTTYPGITTEEGDLTIYNAIDKDNATARQMTREGKANDVATKLVQYGFTVSDINNADASRPQTMLYIYGSGDYSDTIDALKLFMDIDIYTGELLPGHIYTSPLELYLGDSFLEDQASLTNRFW